MIKKVVIPDIGDYQNVPIVEILVKVGDQVVKDQSLITLESDKATMEIPSLTTGIVKNILVKVGDLVSENTPIMEIDTGSETDNSNKTSTNSINDSSDDHNSQEHPTSLTDKKNNQNVADYDCNLVVIGAGPGGYSAAFRAADLGLKVILIERYNTLGGVCLNVGCIPSKTLLHIADIIQDSKEAVNFGLQFSQPKIDINKIRQSKDRVVAKLTTGLSALAKQRQVKIINGIAKFISPNQIKIDSASKSTIISFENAIIAVGSHSTEIQNLPDDSRIINSTGALHLKQIPKSMLVIGGGIIGLELATVYAALGSKITIVELMPSILPGVDSDLVQPLQKKLKANNIDILTATKVTNIKSTSKKLIVSLEAAKESQKTSQLNFDQILIAIGRKPNGHLIEAEKAGIFVDDRGFIPVDSQMRTNVPNIYAIGDVVGEPMLAHKASHQAKVAAEVIAGHKSAFEPTTIPAVAYTNPEVAWSGLSENQAKSQSIKYQKAVFPWIASGRALSINNIQAATKIIYDPDNHRIIGGGIVGKNAGELISEISLAIEMGADINDLALTIHPHPTLSETIGLAAEMAEGTITDLYLSKRN